MGPDLRRTSHVLWFVVALPAMSVALAWLSFHVLALVTWKYAFVLDGLGVLGAYSLLFAFFDSFAWRWRFFRWVHVVDVPVMAGRWKGRLQTSREDIGQLEAVVEIRQRFGGAMVSMYFKDSRSSSLMAQFVDEGHGAKALHYEYQNVPGAAATATMYTHFGTARLEVVPGKGRLDGEYYNRGRDDRGYVGTLSVVWQGKQLLNRFDD